MNRSMVMAIWFLVAEFNGTKVDSQVEQLGWWPNKGKGVRSKVSPTTMCFLQQSAASAPSKSTGSDLNSAVPRAGEEEGEGREKEGGRWLRCTSVPVAGCRGCELEDGASSSKVKEEGFAQREDNARLCRHTDGSSERKRPPGWLRLDFGSRSSIRKRSSRDRRGGSSSGGSSDGSSGRRRSTATSAVVLLRGGEASIASTSLPSETKGSGKGDKDGKGDSKGGGGKEDGSWGINLNVFGWGADSEAEAEAKAEKKRKAQQDMEESEAREAMRKAREERLERELEESGAREEVEKELLEGGPEDKTAGGILVAMAKVADPVGKMFSANDNNRLWLDAVEGFVAAISIVLVSLYPVWHTLRGMFGLSLLFYGDHFSTLAFHIVVFRISGWKKAAKSKNDLVAYYKKARQTMSKAARDVRASAAIIARKNRLVARKEEMMAEKKRLHAMGRVSAEEARAFIDKYRQDIEHIAREQEVLAEASSSILAIKGALSFKKLASSINSLYAAVITSITASTFKRAGQLTLALTCGGLIKRTLFDLLGPIIDPIGYQIELETYVANIMRGPANLYITLVGYLGSASVFFHFFVDPQQALTITFVLLGARVVTDYIVAALNPVRWRFGMSKKLDNMPVSAVIYLSLATLGFAFHGNAGLVGDYLCKPFIAFLGLLNKGLNHFQATTITYFS